MIDTKHTAHHLRADSAHDMIQRYSRIETAGNRFKGSSRHCRIKIWSIATPEPVQADSFTPEATGGTAPMKAVSLSGDAEAYRVTSDNATKSTAFHI